MGEHGSKLAAADKGAIEDAIKAVKEELENKDAPAEALKTKTEALAQASMKLGEAVYKAQQEGGDAGGSGDADAGGDSDVVDADFEEVDDDKKDSA